MARKNEKRAGYGKILDAWVAPEGAGQPVGCVATSFTFSPVFFEEECLGRFLQLETDPGEDGPLYLVEREEKLRQVVCAAVLADQHHCKGSRSLRWDLMPARLRDRVLHAKISVLHWTQWVRVIVASANLTEDGYRRNQEVFGVLDFTPGGEVPLACLTQIVQFLRHAASYSQVVAEPPSPALTRWNGFLERVARIRGDWGTGDGQRGSKGVQVHAVLAEAGRPSVFERLFEFWPGGGPPTEARVVSPFFDRTDGRNRPAQEVWNVLRRRGEADVHYYVTAEDIPGEEMLFVHAPESLKLAQPTGRRDLRTKFYRIDLEVNRPLHAKGIWLENDRWALHMIGSSNFTSAGLGLTPHTNIEANLAYCVDKRRNFKSYQLLKKTFLEGDLIDPKCSIKWQPRSDEDGDSEGEDAVLPDAFGSAVYHCDEKQRATVSLTFTGTPPPGWVLMAEDDDENFFSERDWHHQGSPGEVSVPWRTSRPPSGFWVRWESSVGLAWWPVNVASPAALPPPQELRNLPLEVLIDILTSARPLHRVLGDYLGRKNIAASTGGDGHPVVDPHKRVDTSQFLLQRTRRVSGALNALRERIERPATTEESLHWRFRGPVGVTALAEALIREARSEEEKAFLLSELALELARARPQAVPGSLSPDRVRREIKGLVAELRNSIPTGALEEVENLRRYLDNVFEKILK
ncbi:MAG: hypothetical protein V3R29_10905 [Candidatus Acidoferrales bacterium]